jgi:uncharacterized damage-inducible protein DinB
MGDSLIRHFAMLARYNTLANRALYAACQGLPEEEYRKERPGSFGSIHRALNHILLGDRIWMGRFTSPEMSTTPPLSTVLYDDFAGLRQAREAEDARIEDFMAGLAEDFLETEIRYINSAGKFYSDPPALAIAHMFNHQTHHRGQVHVMLSQTTAPAVSLDMHRAIRPDP